jgi:hypothetical protein
MRYLYGLLALAITLTAGVPRGSAAERAPIVWDGQTVALTQHSRSPLLVVKALFEKGRTVEQRGRSLVAEYDIEDPIPRVGQELLKSVGERHRIVVAAPIPIPGNWLEVENGKHPTRIAATLVAEQSSGDADLALDLVGVNTIFFVLWAPHHYVVETEMHLRVVYVHAAEVLNEVSCYRNSEGKAQLTWDELFADKAARLKALLDAHRDSCLEEFKTHVFNTGRLAIVERSP